MRKDFRRSEPGKRLRLFGLAPTGGGKAQINSARRRYGYSGIRNSCFCDLTRSIGASRSLPIRSLRAAEIISGIAMFVKCFYSRLVRLRALIRKLKLRLMDPGSIWKFLQDRSATWAAACAGV